MPIRILVVDDDAVSRELLALLLRQEGYEAETADSGEDALAHLQGAKDSLPHAVLTDMQMPGLTGEELARQMRSLCGGEVILFAMSGSAVEERLLREFDGFLRKPFRMEALAAALRGRSSQGDGDVRQEAPVLDEAVYEKLAASMPQERLEQLYELCLQDATRRITTMRQAASDEDDIAYRREAHAIKGGCGMVGAVELQTLATSMEDRGLGDANHVVSLDEFVVSCDRLRRILVAHASKIKA